MMQGFYRSAAIVLRIGDRLLQRFEEQIEGDVDATPLDAEFAMKRGYLVARDEFWPGGDMGRVLALFALWADHPEAKGLHSKTARALAESLHALPAYDAAAPELRETFLDLLRGPGPVRTLERMARLGVLGRWIPAFAQVSGRMQFDLFHVYTVDQHTLAVLRNLASFSTGIPDERFSMAHEVCRCCASRNCCWSQVCSTTSPRAAEATIPNSARSTRARSARHTACARPTRRWSNGWCSSTC